MAKRILIVDDEPRYLRLLEANLRTEGYEVVTAQDGAQAVDVFSGQPIDLVLMDVMMPKLDGFGATQRIREFSSTPIIILTAKGDEQDRVRGLDLGADDYLVKPFSATELLARVRAVLRRAQPAGEVGGQSRFFTHENLKIDFAVPKSGRVKPRSRFLLLNIACSCSSLTMSARSCLPRSC